MNEQIITSFNALTNSVNSLVANDTSKNANDKAITSPKLGSNNSSSRSSRNSMNSEKNLSANLKEVASITTNLIIQNAIQGAIDRYLKVLYEFSSKTKFPDSFWRRYDRMVVKIDRLKYLMKILTRDLYENSFFVRS